MNKINTKSGHSSGSEQPGIALLTALRRDMPIRPMAFYEHLIVAERQATRLLRQLGQLEPGVSLDWLTDGSLGNIDVVMLPRWRMESLSGMSSWQDGRWVIGINKAQPHARRRFTLAHEFKHVLDAHRDKITYSRLTTEQREQIADYFAACYLMPKTWLRRAWTGGLQDPEALAGLFKVSQPAMQKRLRYLQFVDAEPDRPVNSYFRHQTDWLFGPSAGRTVA